VLRDYEKEQNVKQISPIYFSRKSSSCLRYKWCSCVTVLSLWKDLNLPATHLFFIRQAQLL